MSLTVVGSIAYDAVETPAGKRDLMLGGAATHFALAASFFDEVRVIGPVGEDFDAASVKQNLDFYVTGPLSGLASIASGLPGTQPPSVFNTDNSTVLDSLSIGAPVNQSDGSLTVNGTATPYTFNGAVGLAPNPAVSGYPLDGHVDPRLVMDVGVMNASQPAPRRV